MRNAISTVERANHALDAATLNHAGLLSRTASGLLRWQDGSSVAFSTAPEGGGRCSLRLVYTTARGEFIDLQIPAVIAPAVCRRWSFTCPCGARPVMRLFIVAGRCCCRHCGPISYESRRYSHARWRAGKRLAACGVQALSEGDLIALLFSDDSGEPWRSSQPSIELDCTSG